MRLGVFRAAVKQKMLGSAARTVLEVVISIDGGKNRDYICWYESVSN